MSASVSASVPRPDAAGTPPPTTTASQGNAAAAAASASLAQAGGSPYIRRPAPSPCQQSLQLEWAFGLHKDFKGTIHNLSGGAASTGGLSGNLSLNRPRGVGAATAKGEKEQRRVFYPLAHVGVLYDVINNSQKHLLGHTHTIIASCCSHNHRFIVTADEGDADAWPLRNTFYKSTRPALLTQEEDMVESAAQEAHMFIDPAAACIEAEDDGSVMIVWDASTGLPVRTIPVGKYGGVLACAVSPDGQFIATINRRTPQEIMVWGWTLADDQDENTSDVRTTTTTRTEAAAAAAVGSSYQTVRGSIGTRELAPEFVRRIPAQDEQTCIRFSLDDPHLLCTNGLRRVMFWSWSEGKLKYYSPPILQRDLKTPVGNLTQTILVPGTTLACSGTVDGDVVLWELQPRDRIVKEQDKMLFKMVRAHTGGVTFLTYEAGYIVTGGMDGHVKFLDSKLRLMAWFEELNAGPVISISFDRPSRSLEENLLDTSRLTQRHMQVNSTAAASEFMAPDFMVSTANAMIIDVPAKSFHTHHRSEMPRGKLIVQGQDQALQCVAAHPKLPRVAIAGLSGNLHLWDYEQRRVLMLCLFQGIFVQAMAFDPTGMFLAVGFTNGSVKILDAETLEDRQTFKPKRAESVLRMCFSEDGRMMATGTSLGMVGLYEYTHPLHDATRPLTWECVGHHKTHRAPICGLQFGHDTNGEAIRLLSVGEDKRLIEYNLVESDVESGLVLRSAHKITQGPLPTGFVWTKVRSVLDPLSRPRQGLDELMGEEEEEARNGFEPDGAGLGGAAASKTGTNAASSGRAVDEDPTLDYLVIATNEYKISVYLSDWSRQCVKTVLAPTFGGPITAMAVVPQCVTRPCLASSSSHVAPSSSSSSPSPSEAQQTTSASAEKCLVYVTGEKVIGLMQLPLLGDPCASVGLLAHPGSIRSFAISHDGAYVFTAGGEDQSVMQWRIDGTKVVNDDAFGVNVPAESDAASDEGRGVVETQTQKKEAPRRVPLDHLIAAIEGGVEGALMKEIMDYFYYAQIRAQGEETSAKRALLGAIPFAQMPNLMRALGYYPTELEIGHLTYEIASMYGPRDEDLAELDVDAILLNFAQFMCFYVNHRPVFGITRQDIERAFTAIGAHADTGEIGRDTFFQLLCTRGEPLRAVEVTAALTSLLGDGVRVDMLEDNITARAFAENLLGFEDYDGGDSGEHGEFGDEEEDDGEPFDDEDAYN